MAFTPRPFINVRHRPAATWVSLDRPPNNAINPAVAHSLMATLSDLASDERIHAIVLTGSGKGDVAGADLPFFARQVEMRDFKRIEQFSAQLHSLCNFIANSPKLIVAAVCGNTLGAGLELALSCHALFVKQTTTLGLPETGLGICPGSGGTQRLPRRIDPGLAKWMIYCGVMLSGKDAVRLGIADQCLVDDDFETMVEEQLDGLRSCHSDRPSPPEEYRALAQVFTQHKIADLLDFAAASSMPSEWDGRTRRAVKSLVKRSRSALSLAERLIDRGSKLPLHEALALEITAQQEMFETADARAGLGLGPITIPSQDRQS